MANNTAFKVHFLASDITMVASLNCTKTKKEKLHLIVNQLGKTSLPAHTLIIVTAHLLGRTFCRACGLVTDQTQL